MKFNFENRGAKRKQRTITKTRCGYGRSIGQCANWSVVCGRRQLNRLNHFVAEMQMFNYIYLILSKYWNTFCWTHITDILGVLIFKRRNFHLYFSLSVNSGIIEYLHRRKTTNRNQNSSALCALQSKTNAQPKIQTKHTKWNHIAWCVQQTTLCFFLSFFSGKKFYFADFEWSTDQK